jgi:hypothetical protein
MEKIKEILCCNEPISLEPNAEQDGVKGFGVFCSNKEHDYGRFHPDRETAITQFLENPETTDNRVKEVTKMNQPPAKQQQRQPQQNTRALKIVPSNMREIFAPRKQELTTIATPILSNDMGAIERLMLNNMERYPLALTGKAWDKIWGNPIGQQSIIKGIEDATIMCAELGKMGDLVPFGTSCQFIPSVEAYEFCLTNGNNAPFEWIMIECIHENDEYSSGSKMGSFFFEKSNGKPRGQVIGAVAYGELKKRGMIVGEIYDQERIMKSAEAHSTSYQYYIRDKKQFEVLKAEGKTLNKNGREYFVKDMGSWKKDVYYDELTNPYDSDREKMFQKAVGKSFFAKYMKVRNSEASMSEINGSKEARKSAVDLSEKQFKTVGEE